MRVGQTTGRRLFWIAGASLILVTGLVTFLMGCSSFGGDVAGMRLERVKASPHYDDDQFVNTVRQSPWGIGQTWDYLSEQFTGDQVRVPPGAIPVDAFPAASLTPHPAKGLRAIWLGHASVYVELDGLRLLVDPIFSDRASPFEAIGPQRFHAPPIALHDLPDIDAVLISHDHYDHLDMRTIQYLSTRGARFFVPLGVGAHLDEWGVPKGQIRELEWGQSEKLANLKIVSTPSRHYSGRGLFDYKKTFWSSWSVIGPEQRFFYSGDTGFSDHFEKIGAAYGPFDLSILKIGAYGPGASWIDIHMTPEHAVEAHLALKARRMLPVHWATFNLALHDWDAPIKRAVKAAAAKNVTLLTPRIGEVVDAAGPNRTRRWWEAVK